MFAELTATWSACAEANPDLLLVTKDGVMEAHRALLFPLSENLKSLVEATSCCGPAQAVLPEVSYAAMAAVKDLVYKGVCLLEKVNLSEILEALRVLGIKVMLESFGLEVEPRRTQGNSQAITQHHPSTEDPTRLFVCTQCPKRFRMKHHLKTHTLIHSGEMPFSCHHCSKKFNRSYTLKKHMKIHSAGRDKKKFQGQDNPSSTQSVHEHKEAKQEMEVNNEDGKPLWLPLADGGKPTVSNHTEHTNSTKSINDVDKKDKWQCEMMDIESNMLPKVSSANAIEDEICFDQIS